MGQFNKVIVRTAAGPLREERVAVGSFLHPFQSLLDSPPAGFREAADAVGFLSDDPPPAGETHLGLIRHLAATFGTGLHRGNQTLLAPVRRWPQAVIRPHVKGTIAVSPSAPRQMTVRSFLEGRPFPFDAGHRGLEPVQDPLAVLQLCG